jgi:hypothetical protein
MSGIVKVLLKPVSQLAWCATSTVARGLGGGAMGFVRGGRAASAIAHATTPTVVNGFKTAAVDVLERPNATWWRDFPELAQNFMHNMTGGWLSNGVKSVKDSNFYQNLKNLHLDESAGGTKWGDVGDSVGKLGFFGVSVLGGLAASSLAAVGLGAKHAYGQYKEYSSEKKGESADHIQQPLVRLSESLTSGLMSLGGVTAIAINPAIGLAMVGAGLAGTIVCVGIRKVLGGFHFMNHPEVLPHPLDKWVGGWLLGRDEYVNNSRHN